MGHENIGACSGHFFRLFDVEDVRRGEEIKLIRHANHVDLRAKTHAGLLKIGTENTVDETNRRKVLHAREANLFDLLEEVWHHPERVCAVHTR